MDELITFNGLNGATGSYLLPEMSVHEISRIARGETFDPDHFSELKRRHQTAGKPTYGARDGIDVTKISQAGWGVIFAHEDGEEVERRRAVLKPLLDLRREQAGKFYREYIGQTAYRSGESYVDFLVRNGSAPGQSADPNIIPYYLLIVASPASVPYRFQYQLDVVYAVGRIHFSTLEDYSQYAVSVVAAETGEITRDCSVAFFGAQNAADKATHLSARELVTPLAQKISDSEQSWQVSTHIKDKAYKKDLLKILNSPSGPALLFTATHGMGFPKNDHMQRQHSHQGALVCQDWPGPLQWLGKPIPPDYYFSADDLETCNVAGLIGFHFACYSAGTPLLNEFAHQPQTEHVEITDKAFVAKLPQRMLTHSNGGALAVIGHVERAWNFSFTWPGAGRQISVFEDTIKRLLDGYPAGAALEFFNAKYSELSTVLHDELDSIKSRRKSPDDRKLAQMWTAVNDARSYAIVGDPAVRLAVSRDN